jgi:hypothetical protein
MQDTNIKKSFPRLLGNILLATIIISILGYIDYLTGEISIDILYLLCICLVAWHTNTFLSILCIIEIFLAKTTADYFCKVEVGTSVYEWNALNYILILVVISLLVRKLKKVLSA